MVPGGWLTWNCKNTTIVYCLIKGGGKEVLFLHAKNIWHNYYMYVTNASKGIYFHLKWCLTKIYMELHRFLIISYLTVIISSYHFSWRNNFLAATLKSSSISMKSRPIRFVPTLIQVRSKKHGVAGIKSLSSNGQNPHHSNLIPLHIITQPFSKIYSLTSLFYTFDWPYSINIIKLSQGMVDGSASKPALRILAIWLRKPTMI